MNPERMLQILIEPRMSEKATRATEKHNQYVFKVTRDASKPEIKTAVEQLFNVRVTSVRVVNVGARVKRFRGRVGVRQAFRKAYVTLQTGTTIDFLGAA